MFGDKSPLEEPALNSKLQLLISHLQAQNETNRFLPGVIQSKLPSVNMKQHLYELELHFSAPKKKRPASPSHSSVMSKSPSARSIQTLKSASKSKSKYLIFGGTLKVYKNKTRTKSFGNTESHSVVQSTKLLDSKLESGVKPKTETRFIVRDSLKQMTLNKSLDFETNKLPLQSKSLNASQEFHNTQYNSSKKIIKSEIIEISQKANQEIKKTLTSKGKSDIAEYFLSRSKPQENKKKVYFFTESNEFSEVKLPKRRFRHLCYASAMPSFTDDQEDDEKKPQEAPDLDVYTVKAAPRSVYLKNNDMAGMLDDCLLGTFNKHRGSLNPSTQKDPPIGTENMNKQYFKMQKQIIKEREAFKFVRKVLKTKHVDTVCAKDLNDFGRNDLVTFQGTEDFIRKKLIKEKKDLKEKKDEHQVISILGIMATKDNKAETKLKKLQRLIYEHRTVTLPH